jgi:hypothetical protein
LTAVLVAALALSIGCEPPPAPPPPTPVPFGTITGRALVEEGAELVSVDGAVVEVYGSSEVVTTEAGKNFVLGAVPLGTHTVRITHPGLDRAVQFEATLQAPFETLSLEPSLTTLARAATLIGTAEVSAAENAKAYLVGGNAEQQADIGDDGQFTLRNLPTGTVEIGVSAIGRETQIFEVTLGEGDNDAPADLEIAPSAVDDLRIAGRVQLLEETVHEGVTVLLNGGEQVVATDEEGNFTFANLGPGLYSVRAQRPGFRSAELPSIALESDGDANGLVPVSLAPGNDDVEVEPVDPALRDFDIEINNPVAGQTFEDGETVTFVATAADQGVALTDIEWTRQDDADAAPVSIGSGEAFSAALPVGEHIVSATVTAADGAQKTDRVVITVAPFDYELTVSILEPTGIEPIPEGVPAILRAATTVRDGFLVSDADIEWSFRVAASSDPFTILGTGSQITVPDLPIGELELRVDVSADAGAATASDSISLSVVAIDFTATILAPLVDPDPANPDAPPYFTDFGLPLKVNVDHSVQGGFERSKLRWFHDQGGGNLTLIATGLNARTFLLPAGAGTIRFEAEDDFGNVISETAVYSLQQIDVSVGFGQPEEFTNLLEGTAFTANVFYTHSLVDQAVVPESQLVVRYFSDIQGLLTDTTGATSFGVNDSPQFDILVPGRHTLTASMDDGAGRIVVDTRVIDIRSPGVNAIPVSPLEGLVVFAGDPVDFVSTVTFDQEVAPIFTWKIDGVEFDAAWDDYGADPNFAGRADIRLGNYTPAAGIFADARLAPGRHVVEFQVRLPDVDPGLGCVNIADRSACFRRTIDFVDGNPELCPGGLNQTITSAAPVVISGVALLNCRYQVNGADVIIEPGARIIVERGGQSIPQFRLFNGSLTIGAEGNAEEVIIESQGGGAVPNNWVGITVEPNTNSTPTLLDIANTTIRHADNAVSVPNSNYVGDVHRTELRDVTLEDSREGIVAFCPDVMENVVIRGMTEDGVRESSGHKCGAIRTWENLTIEDLPRGIELDLAGTALINNVHISGNTNQAIQLIGTATNRLELRDSVLENSTNGIDSSSCTRMVVENTLFHNNGVGLRARNCSRQLFQEPSWDVRRSVFTNNQTAIFDDRFASNPGQDARVSMSTFQDNVVDIDTRSDGNAIHASGNFFGDAGDNTSAGGVLASLPAGSNVNLPRIIDFLDDANNVRIIRVDNPLSAPTLDPADAPVAYIEEPRQTSSYHLNANGCIPLVAEAPGKSIAVLQPGQDPVDFPGVDAHCLWFGDGPSGDPLAGDRLPLRLDSDGCWDTVDTPVSQGEHAVALECTDAVTGGVDQQVVRFLLDDNQVRGTVHRANTIWDEDVFVSGDVTVPRGSTLTINPGVTVTFAESDTERGRRFPDYNRSQDDTANAGFGALTKLDIFVDGDLVAIGDVADPIIFKSAAAAPGQDLWGGIRVEQNASATLQHVEFESAGITLHGSLNPDDPTTAADISISDAAFRDVGNVLRGVCPSTSFDRVTAIRSKRAMFHVFCKQTLSWNDVTMTNMGVSTQDLDMNVFQSYVTNGPANYSITFDNTRISRDTGNRLGKLFQTTSGGDVGQIVIRNSTFIDFFELFVFNTNGAPSQYAIVIEDSHLEGFDRLMSGGTQPETFNLTRTTVRDADHLFTNGDDAQSITILDSRFNDMLRPFEDFDLGSPNITLSVTGSVFENITGAVFDARAAGSTNTIYSPDFSGNNFVNINRAIFYDAPTNGRAIRADFTGNFWGVATEAEVRALISDPQTPTGVPALEEGQTDITGFSATALALPNVPDQP